MVTTATLPPPQNRHPLGERRPAQAIDPRRGARTVSSALRTMRR